MITDETKSLLATYLEGLILSGQIGLGGNSTSPASTTLDVPLTVTVSKVSDKTSQNVVQVKLEILGHATPASGDLLQRMNFAGVGPFSSSERLQIYLTMEIE